MARLLADYFLARRRPFFGFDTDPHESPFAVRFPGLVEVADLATVKGQIALFDQLLRRDATPRIVDVWARSWSGFLKITRETGLVEEARRLDIEPVFLLVVDDAGAWIDAANGLLAQWPDLRLVLARNHGLAAGVDTSAHFPGLRDFDIAGLDPIVAQAMERPELSLSRFLVAPPVEMSIVVRTALRTWVLGVFTQIQAYELRVAMDERGGR